MPQHVIRPVVLRPSVLFVCTANVCRSPMAEALFRARLMMRPDLDWRLWRVDSAGTWAEPGQPAISEAQQVIARRGLDISAHRSRLVSFDLLQRFQLVLTMEPGQQEALRAEFAPLRERIFMISEMSGQVVAVRDPVGGSPAEYERAAHAIDRWISNGMERIVALACPPNS